MKHLETGPVEKTALKGKDTQPKKRPLSVVSASLIGLFMIGGIGFGLTNWWNPLPVDHISNKEKAELVAQFTKIRSIAIEKVQSQDIDTVLDSMRLEPTARRAMKKSLEGVNGPATTVLARIVLWDFASEDGDVVNVSSAGYEIAVPLMNKPVTITVPIDASRTIKLTGTNDGGGGITVGIQDGAGKISLPVITTGQVLYLPVGL